MNFSFKDWVALAVSIVFAIAVFGNIASKAGYSRWYGMLMAIPFLNVIVLIWFAYTTWPIESERLQLQFGDSKPAIWRDET